MVSYIWIDGERVSKEWGCVLHDMRDDGVVFNVNEGHRTMARQWYFWNGYRKRLPGFNLAAFPSPFAPHIRTGRIDHAIDFSNDARVFAWLQRKGLNPRRTVAGESWHIEVSAADLRAYYKAYDKTSTVVRKGSRGQKVKTLQVLLRQAYSPSTKKGYLRSSWKVHDKYTLHVRRAVRKFQREHQLHVDGVVGPRTWKSLRAARKV